MRPVMPKRGVHTLEDRGNRLRIIIPARKQWYILIFHPIWLVAWTVAGITAIQAISKHFDLFLLVWLVLWAMGWCFAALTVLWMAVGKEIIEISGGSMIRRLHIFSFSYAREYLASHIQDLRVLPTTNTPFGIWGARRQNVFIFNEGMLAFDYGAKTIHFAGGIDEAEGKQILAEILQRFPQYQQQ